jgi:hypothetical protein
MKCAYCGKDITQPAYSIRMDIDLPTLYFCSGIDVELWIEAIADLFAKKVK